MPSCSASARPAAMSSRARAASPGALRSRSIEAQARRVRTIDGRAPKRSFIASASAKWRSASSQRPRQAASMPAELAVGPLAVNVDDERLRLFGDGTHPLVEHRRRGSVLEIADHLAQSHHGTRPCKVGRIVESAAAEGVDLSTRLRDLIGVAVGPRQDRAPRRDVRLGVDIGAQDVEELTEAALVIPQVVRC